VRRTISSGALDALGVVGLQAGGGVRVEAGQLGVQRRPAVAGGGVLDLAAQGGSASGRSDSPSRRAL
jgi:hypothetical protein